VARRVFSKSFEQAAAQLAVWDFPVEALRRALGSQEAREARVAHAAASIDAALADLAEPTATATALFMEHGARLVGVSGMDDVMRRIGRAFGALIYLLDALEDYDKDVRNGEFNAIRAAFRVADERLPAGVRRQVADSIWSRAAEVETALGQLPIDTSRAHLFASRLRHNLSHKLGARLPVVAHACRAKHAAKKPLRERWREAVTTGRELTRKRVAERGSTLVARVMTPFVFASVLPVAFLFPQETAQAGSYRECLGLGLNLMAIGSLAAAIAGRLRFASDSPNSDSADVEAEINEEIRKSRRKRKAAAAGGGSGGGNVICCCGDCDCCCDGCDCCDCCSGCDGCGGCCDGCDCCSCDC
jgi:hypothetical protein